MISRIVDEEVCWNSQSGIVGEEVFWNHKDQYW